MLSFSPLKPVSLFSSQYNFPHPAYTITTMKKVIRRALILLVALALVLGGAFFALKTLFPDLELTPQTITNITGQIDKISQQNKASKHIISHDTTIRRTTADGQTINLYGKVYAPSNYQRLKLPVMILAHGYNSNADFADSLAPKVAEQGYVVYAFDFYGGSTNSRSGDRDMLDMSIQTEKADLEAVLAHWHQQTYVDTGHIYLTGISHGGLISTMVAAAHPKDVRALILLAPAYNVPDLVKDGYQKLGFTSEDQIPPSVTYENRTIGRRYVLDALHYDPTADQKAYTGPVLIIHGTADELVPYSYSEAAVKNFAHAQLVPLEGTGHTADAQAISSALPQLAAFLLQN
ncbi:Alpha/beta hydrolase family [Alloscardovia macacae]|uniref:Alpha/beta hydrolase family n=2 Tax=Alloscardovia macacae TaxID=1160091 RepID=A0A261F3G5_9BIFI|nr:Alpha/beta hydrolase family [Alloscardovia macacae]